MTLMPQAGQIEHFRNNPAEPQDQHFFRLRRIMQSAITRPALGTDARASRDLAWR
jgi:hypothetical protein